jgi:hypothetical protein
MTEKICIKRKIKQVRTGVHSVKIPIARFYIFVFISKTVRFTVKVCCRPKTWFIFFLSTTQIPEMFRPAEYLAVTLGNVRNASVIVERF